MYRMSQNVWMQTNMVSLCIHKENCLSLKFSCHVIWVVCKYKLTEPTTQLVYFRFVSMELNVKISRMLSTQFVYVWVGMKN